MKRAGRGLFITGRAQNIISNQLINGCFFGWGYLWSRFSSYVGMTTESEPAISAFEKVTTGHLLPVKAIQRA